MRARRADAADVHTWVVAVTPGRQRLAVLAGALRPGRRGLGEHAGRGTARGRRVGALCVLTAADVEAGAPAAAHTAAVEALSGGARARPGGRRRCLLRAARVVVGCRCARGLLRAGRSVDGRARRTRGLGRAGAGEQARQRERTRPRDEPTSDLVRLFVGRSSHEGILADPPRPVTARERAGSVTRCARSSAAAACSRESMARRRSSPPTTCAPSRMAS